jgi:hypothetical protein
MKLIALLCLLISYSIASFAQKQTYDLVSFNPPKGWTIEEKQNVIVYTKVDKKNKTWCQIGVYKSTVSKGNIEDDLQSEWNEMAVKQFNITDTMQATETQEADGWKIKTGSGKFTFNNQPAAVLLTTFSGYDRCTSIIATTNSQSYLETIENFIGSIEVKKPETSKPQSNEVNVPVIGSWGKSNTVSQVNNRFGNYSYNKQQYTFNSDGSYGFAAKTYDEKSSETYLIKEKGRFVISGNAITLTPKTSVIEAWSKKNGADNWNQLKSTQKRLLEIVTYQFTIANNNLLLEVANQTERDGKFNNGNTYSYGPPGTFTPITLPEGDEITSEKTNKEPVNQTTTPTNSSVTSSGFTFTSTNFDDGWTSTVQEDWVEVTKGNMKVLLHYPKDGTIFPADPEPLTNAAWNILVAPRYSNLKNYKTAYVEDSKRPYFGMGYATENKTGKSVFIVLFRRGGGWFEVVTTDNISFTQEFGFNPETIRWGSISEYMGGWIVNNSQGNSVKADPEVFDKLENMIGRNKFAVAAADLNNTGEWKDHYSSNTFYFNYYTGASAGMSTYSSSNWFVFKAGNHYHWELAAANSYGGQIATAKAKGDGTYKSLNNWQLFFTEMEGKPKTFDVYFSAIKGGRVLWMNDAKVPGSGIFTGYKQSK